MHRSLSSSLLQKTTKVFNVSLAFLLVSTSLGGILPVLVAQTADALSGASTVYMSPSASGDCSQANPCGSFTDALNAVATNGTIHVGAGTYTTAVSITKSVRMIGAGEGSTFIVAPASLPAEGNIIDISGPAVNANISSMTIEGAGPSTCGSIMSGIFVENSATAYLHNLTVDNIRDNPLSGCQNGRAILVGWGHGSTIPNTTGTATINHVTISGYQKAGVEVSGAGSSATVENNTITGVGSTPAIAANGIEVTFGASANVKNNTVTDNIYTGSDFATGILLYNAMDSTRVSGNTISGNQFGLWTNTPGSLTHLDISGITSNGRNSVADTTGWPTPPTSTYADSALAGISNTDGSTIVITQGHAHVWGYDAFNTVQSALNAVATGGHVYIANGTYHENLNIPKNSLRIYGQSETSTIVNTGSGYGITVDHQNGTHIDDITFNSVGDTGYALHAYGANGLSLNSLTFNGPGKSTHVGGVDINSSQNVSINNVVSRNYGKNGFAVTSQYNSVDNYSRNVTFNSITADSNGWDGIAFYTTNSTGDVGHNITGVVFKGTNTITNNGNSGNPTQGGIFVEGDSDSAYFFCGLLGGTCPGVPHYTVTSPGGILLLSNTNFSGNSIDIVNFQTAEINALSAQFSSLTGNEMTAAQHAAENALIFDHRDESILGLVNYYSSTVVLPAPNLQAPSDGSVVNGASVTNSWSTVPGAVKYEYESFNNNDPNSASRFDADFVTTSKTATNVADGTIFYWRVRAIDSEGNPGAWSNGGNLWKVTVDNTAPVVAITNPNNNDFVSGTVNITGTITDNNPDHYYLVVLDQNNHVVAGPGVVNSPVTSFSYAWDTSTLTDGTYTIDLEARDAAGNKNSQSTQKIQVTVDNDAPAISDNFTIGMLTGQKTTLDPQVTDTTAVTYQWSVSDSKLLNNPSDTLDGTSLTIGPAPKGNYTVTLTVTDAAGNATTKQYSVAISTPAPSSPFVNHFNSPQVLGASTSNTGNTSSTDDNTPNTPAGTPNDGQVMGDSTTQPSGTNLPATLSMANTSNFFSKVGWWWLAILAAIAVLSLLVALRRSGTNSTQK